MTLSRLALVCLLSLSSLSTALLVRAGDDDDGAANDATRAALEKKKAELYAKNLYDETGATRMPAPKKGDWLFRFTETGQNFEDYKKECANRRTKERAKLYVTELGEQGKRSVAVQPIVRDFLHEFFQLEVVRRDPGTLPARAYEKSRDQYDANTIMTQLRRDVPADALASVGLLDQDLFVEGLNFVFGVGSLAQRVGVYSFTRFGHEGVEDTLYEKRCFRLVGHEVGHIFGIEHCVYYECIMNGVNSLAEDDTKPLHLCPVCLAKLQWNIGFDDLTREKGLAKLLEREKIEDEARWSKSIARLEKKLEKKP